MFGYLSLDYLFLEAHSLRSRKTVLLEQIMSMDKYPSIFSRQMEAFVNILFPNLVNCARCERDLKDNKLISLHLARKHARILVLGHYLFLEYHSFPRATLSENCLLLGTDNACGQVC